MMVYVLRTDTGTEAHAAPVRHPDAIDWVRCKDSKEAQKVIELWNKQKLIGIPVSVNTVLQELSCSNDPSSYKDLSFDINEEGHIYIKDLSKE